MIRARRARRIAATLVVALAGGGAGCAKKAPRAHAGIPPALVERAAPATGPIRLPPITEKELPNGLTVLVLEDHELPVASLAVFWPAGETSDPPGLAGLASMTASLLRQGTTTRDAEEIAEAIESVGGELAGAAAIEWSTLGVQVLSRDFELALGLLADIARNPSFPEDELEDLRRQTLGDLKLALDDPDAVASRFAPVLVWGAENPYAAVTTERTVRAIRREDVLEHARTKLGPAGAILAIAGDVDTDALLPRVERLFGGWKGPAAAPPALPAQPEARREVLLVDKPGLTQSHVWIGLPAFPRKHPDYPAALLANGILGGSYTSRLTKVVRADGGKTYGVSSWFSARRHQGAFWVSTSTRTEETVATLELVLGEVRKMRDGGVKPNELSHAKSHRIGSYPQRFETGGDTLLELVTARLLGFPETEVTGWRAIVADTDREAVDAAAKRWMDVDRARIVVVGDADSVRPMLEKAFGEVRVVDFRTDPASIGTGDAR